MPALLALEDTTSRFRLLVVDDEPQTLVLLRTIFEREGFDVLTATSGPEALQLVDRHGLPHLALVDLMMPVMDGFSLCRQIHEYTDLPVIMLTAIGDEATIVQGLDTCAEDYIVKPFRTRELVARVRRVLKRMGSYSYALAANYKIDERLQVNLARKTVTVAGHEIPLTPTECKLLYILMRNAGQIVTTDFLVRRLWAAGEGTAHSLRVHLHRLRNKIEADPGEPHYILTERGDGYRFLPHR